MTRVIFSTESTKKRTEHFTAATKKTPWSITWELLLQVLYYTECVHMYTWTYMHGCSPYVLNINNTHSCKTLQTKKANQSLTLMIISSVCVERVSFGALPVTNNDTDLSWQEFRKSTKERKKNKHMLICAASQLYKLNPLQLQELPKCLTFILLANIFINK